MTDIGFKLGRRIRRASMIASAVAVLNRLNDDRDADIHVRVGALITMWRRRVGNLQTAGWRPRNIHAPENPADWTFLRNCRPSFCEVYPASRVCTLESICPFCYARRVARWYTAWNRKWQPYRRTHDLISRKFWFTRPMVGDDYRCSEVEWLQDNIDAWIKRRSQFFRGLDAIGATSLFNIEPWKGEWKFSCRQLIAVKRNVEPAFPNDEGVEYRVQRFSTPTAHDFFTAFVRTCEYPYGMMWGKPDRVMVILHARQRRRFTATSGIFLGDD